ncbi:Carbohydrate esterase 4 protein [Tulasnella sp. 417]|nr:Carbohydrate esterase 4 protein [Tulasnella sp. 417]
MTSLSFSPHLSSVATVMSEMTRTDEALMKILGVKPAFVRPPYGKYNDRSEQVAEENGQSIVIWDFDSRDSIGASPDESKEEYRKVADKRPPTILTLNHETYETTAHDVLPYALDILRDNGYNFVSVAECLGGMEPYAKRTDPAVRDDSWTC